MNTSKHSLYSYISCVLLILYVAFIFNPKWNNKAGESSLGWDAAGYYWYLPSLFIYHDLKQQKFGDSMMAKYDFTPDFEQSFVHESGNRVNTYSSGLALVQLPAFTIAHTLAKPLGYAPDGFSLPYQVAVQLWGLLGACIGLWFFRRLLLLYFSDKATAITLFLLVFGSNYLNYSAVDVTITHSWLFTIYVFLMLNTRQFYITPSYKYATRIGLLTGLAILIRPSEMVAVLIPLLWGMESISFTAIKNKFSFLIKEYRLILVAVLCAVLVGSVQVIYWLYVTGQPLVYSYADKGFYWTKPHFSDFTFSYRSGWLVYTPLLFFIFPAIVVYIFKGKNKIALISFFLLNYYIVAAWDVWWYGGMGGRAMVQSYAVGFIMIAALIDVLLNTRWLKWPVFAVMGLFVYINIWFTYNAHAKGGLYDPVGMTKAYYWAVVGRFKVPEYTVRLKDTDEYFNGVQKNMKLIYQNGFDDDIRESDTNPVRGHRSAYFFEGRQYSSEIRIPANLVNSNWLRAMATVKMMGEENEEWKMLQYTIRFIHRGEKIKANMIRVNRFVKKGETKQVYFDVKIPAQPYDSIDILFWNPGSTAECKIDDIEIWSFNE